METCAITEI